MIFICVCTNVHRHKNNHNTPSSNEYNNGGLRPHTPSNSMTSPTLLHAPPIVVTNPEVVKYLICQLWTEAVLVLTLVLLVPSILWEEWRHYSKNRQRDKKMKKVGEVATRSL